MDFGVKKGFTLLELIVVLGILSIVGLGAVNSVSAFLDVGKLDRASRQLISDLRLAKIYAMTNTGVSVKVLFSFSGNSYKVYYIDQNLNTEYIADRRLEKNIILDPVGSTFSNGGIGDALKFYSNGGVNMACSIVLTDVFSGGSRKITLTVGYTRVDQV